MRSLLLFMLACLVTLFGLNYVKASDCAGLVQTLPRATASYSYSQKTVIERVETPVYDVAPVPVPVCSCQTITNDLPAASYYPSYSTGTYSHVSRSYDLGSSYDVRVRTPPVRYLGPPVREQAYYRPPVRDIGRSYYPPREIVRERIPVYSAPRERIREVPIPVPVREQPAGVFANLRARTAAGAGAGGLFGAAEGLTGFGDGSGQFLQGALIARFLPGGGGFRFKR